ncbi:MAG TPA: hypothetical protein VEV44_03865 [Pseudoneobacillus sp.]|nr:hypothetical protein [Pseudoneobacillus sp.]
MLIKLKMIIRSLSLFITGAVFFIFVQLSNPLQIDGVSTTTYEEGKEELVFHIYNQGIKRIKIKEVAINSNKLPKEVSLGVSYDGQLVKGGTDNPFIKFMRIDSEFIEPRLSQEEFKAAIKRRDMTPIHYGIRVEFYGEVIKKITIKYKYFGFPVKKTFLLERWNLGN